MEVEWKVAVVKSSPMRVLTGGFGPCEDCGKYRGGDVRWCVWWETALAVIGVWEVAISSDVGVRFGVVGRRVEYGVGWMEAFGFCIGGPLFFMVDGALRQISADDID